MGEHSSGEAPSHSQPTSGPEQSVLQPGLKKLSHTSPPTLNPSPQIGEHRLVTSEQRNPNSNELLKHPSPGMLLLSSHNSVPSLLPLEHF